VNCEIEPIGQPGGVSRSPLHPNAAVGDSEGVDRTLALFEVDVQVEGEEIAELLWHLWRIRFRALLSVDKA
jgi:hypothetical protein